MSGTTNFIAELVRAANGLDKLTGREKRRLLERSVTAIRDMRESVGIPSSNTAVDAVLDIQQTEVLLVIGEATDAQVKTSLLAAADMIRTLHIVLDTETEVLVSAVPRAEARKTEPMREDQIPDFVHDLLAVGCDICAIGDAHYVIGGTNIAPKDRRAAKKELERIEREYADRDHLRPQIAAYLQSIGQGVPMPMRDP